MQFIESNDFKRDFKKLSKKYPTLKSDFENLKRVILKEPTGIGTKHWNKIKADIENDRYIFKTRMMCRSTKGSNFRIIYLYDGNKIEILFIEIYFKGRKVNENRERIEKFWKEIVGE